MILVFGEIAHGDEGDVLAGPSRQALALARSMDELLDGDGHRDGNVVVLVIDDGDVDLDELAVDAGRHGAAGLHVARHELLDAYGPETWGQAVTELVEELDPRVVLAAGTDRGGEVLAQAAARLDRPLVANVTAVTGPDDGGWALTRARWGGSLLEHARLEADRVLATVLPHAVEAAVVEESAVAELVDHDVDLDAALARSRVVEEAVTSTGISLATAPVVVGGGRGVGSAEGFASLERLAELLGGAVGCSRVATNNGWRPHSDQVGQTGTAIAPTVYIACGISGAIQHWAGAKSAKHVLAINTDAEANMVARADWAVVGDLHQVVPALVDAIEAR